MSATATILIVDDHPTNLKLAAYILESEGYTIARARDAEEVLEVLKHIEPNLILMDIQMPGMDGLKLTRLLQADSSYQHIPIVALTAFAMIGDEDKAKEAGCCSYITKPIETRKFSREVAEILATAPRSKAHRA
jgi:CheY-like chemotaxis protein